MVLKYGNALYDIHALRNPFFLKKNYISNRTGKLETKFSLAIQIII